MGHFFRALILARALKGAGEACKLLINPHEPALQLLKKETLDFMTVDLGDLRSGWEARLIKDQGIRVWIDDRLDTEVLHAQNVKACGIPLATFDDRGSGAALADLNIAALAFDPAEALPGRRVLRGIGYLVLNPDIARYRRLRTSSGRLLVTLGGSDTYGVTVKVVRLLRAAGRRATVIVGPAFQHHDDLADAFGPGFELKRNIPSLIAEFAHYDLAITGGGMTAFEANASGLPCIVIANEIFEIPVGRGLAEVGGSVFAGHHSDMDESALTRDLPVEAMSRAGMEGVTLEGTGRVVRELVSL